LATINRLFEKNGGVELNGLSAAAGVSFAITGVSLIGMVIALFRATAAYSTIRSLNTSIRYFKNAVGKPTAMGNLYDADGDVNEFAKMIQSFFIDIVEDDAIFVDARALLNVLEFNNDKPMDKLHSSDKEKKSD